MARRRHWVCQRGGRSLNRKLHVFHSLAWLHDSSSCMVAGARTCKMSASSPTLARADVATNTAYSTISRGSALSSFLSLFLLLTKPCARTIFSELHFFLPHTGEVALLAVIVVDKSACLRLHAFRPFVQCPASTRGLIVCGGAAPLAEELTRGRPDG